VSGKVVNEAGEPLIGATVLLRGSSIGTITDMKGKYSLKIPTSPSALVVSYPGYGTQEIPVYYKEHNIVFGNDAQALNELLQGQAAGLAIRGSRSDATNYYIDGVRVTGNLPPKQTIVLENKELYQPTTVNFEIEVPYTILNDGKTYSVDIKSESIPAIYEYFATPKLDENAYLTAHITGWQDLNLLDGEVNLFFEGGYLGKSLLDTKNSSDTLDISLGIDKSISVRRTRIKEFSARQLIGNSKTERRAFEIVVRNNKQQPVKLTVTDQFPISTNKEISVEDLKYEGASLEKDSQILTWKLSLSPKEEHKMELHYSVKYPKKQRLTLE
jgi:uncharacterized protein (TIGR02231 family)